MTSQPVELLTGDIHLVMDKKSITFTRLPSTANPNTEKWITPLKFTGWNVAMHPPTNVVAVSQWVPRAYVVCERFLYLGRIMLKKSTRV